MLHRITLPALALGFLLAASASGQHHHMGVDPKDYDDGGGRGGDDNAPAGCSGVQAKITITGTSFSPSTVTVDPGQPVCWTWSQSVQHNVHADDDSFTSGAPAGQGTFQTTFTAPGLPRLLLPGPRQHLAAACAARSSSGMPATAAAAGVARGLERSRSPHGLHGERSGRSGDGDRGARGRQRRQGVGQVRAPRRGAPSRARTSPPAKAR